ncbi:hypothetical protein SLE2022_272950 [Rubroshorea leprosula]
MEWDLCFWKMHFNVKGSLALCSVNISERMKECGSILQAIHLYSYLRVVFDHVEIAGSKCQHSAGTQN